MNRISNWMIAALATMACLGGFSCAKQPPVAATLKPSPDASPRVSVKTADAPKPVLGASKYPVIVHVVSRDKTVTISSGPKGPVYSVAMNEGGKVLIADATGEELEKVQPELYRAIHGYMAVKNNEAFMFDGVSANTDKAQAISADEVWADLSAR
jgi:hypothetical protein